jgi:hypothetical protein
MIISKANIQASLIRAPSVFQPEEGNLQKYAAAVAATEPFLIQCQYQLKNSMNPLKSWFGRVISGKCQIKLPYVLTKNRKISSRTSNGTKIEK